MRIRALIGTLGLWLVFGSSPHGASAAEEDAELLVGERWQELGLITGFHSVRHKKSGFEVRLLEADGSASVAWDPIGLYLVVTNNATSDGLERVWRLRRGVARVKGLVPTSCGVDIRVDVDRITSDGEVRGTMQRILRVCLFNSKGALESRPAVNEVAP